MQKVVDKDTIINDSVITINKLKKGFVSSDKDRLLSTIKVMIYHCNKNSAKFDNIRKNKLNIINNLING